MRAFVPKGATPQVLWQQNIGLTQIEENFKAPKGDLSFRPIYHQLSARVEARIFISFLAYCLRITLGMKLKALGSGLTTRAVLEKFAMIQVIDIDLPVKDQADKCLVMPRYTQPDKEKKLLLARMGSELAPQPPSRIESVEQFRGEAFKN